MTPGYLLDTNVLSATASDRRVVPDPASGRHEVHGATEHLRILTSTAPPVPGGPGPRTLDHSPAELHVRRALTLAA